MHVQICCFHVFVCWRLLLVVECPAQQLFAGDDLQKILLFLPVLPLSCSSFTVTLELDP